MRELIIDSLRWWLLYRIFDLDSIFDVHSD